MLVLIRRKDTIPRWLIQSLSCDLPSMTGTDEINISERTDYYVEHFGLIAVQFKDIVDATLDNRLCNLPLTVHGVYVDYAVSLFQNTQQFRYGGYLVTFASDLFLCKQKIICRSPGADKWVLTSGYMSWRRHPCSRACICRQWRQLPHQSVRQCFSSTPRMNCLIFCLIY